MKELDFLPNWYRDDRQRILRRHRHYVLFGLVVVLLAGWSIIVGRSVSNLKAQTQQIQTALEKGQQTLLSTLEKELQIETLGRQAVILETLTPRTAISAVLGELAFCVNKQIIYSKVSLVLEPIEDTRPKAAPATGGVVRLAAAKPAQASAMPDSPQRIRVTLTGIAAGGADVARLIERLETSDYFESVSPGFSRAKKVGSRDVTEFEITCWVADYAVKR